MARTVRQIKDAFPNSFTGKGLFTAFDNPVWKDNFIASDLDILFITRYGEKIESPFLEHFDTGNGVSDSDLTTVARTIYSVFSSQWVHLWKANISEYNPIENTDAYISITDTHENTTSGTTQTDTDNTTIGTGTITHGIEETVTVKGTGTVKNVIDEDTTGTTQTDTDNTTTGTGTITHGIDETVTVKGTGTVKNVIDEDTSGTTKGTSSGSDSGENNLFGFNSSAAVSADTSKGSTSAVANSNSSGTRDETDTETRDTTDNTTRNTTDTETRNTTDKLTGKQTATTSGTGNGTDTHEEHRHGNIGVTTNAQLIQGEIETWKWSFIDTVMNDICKLIALSVY